MLKIKGKKKDSSVSMGSLTAIPKYVESSSKKMTFNDFMHEIKTIELDDYGLWSKPVKMLSWGLIFGVTAVASYCLTVQPIIEQIERSQRDRGFLLDEYKVKKEKLVGAEMYQAQLVEVERKFNEQLSQLPKETEIPGLVEDISRLGRISGLNLENIELDEEVKREVFIEQPISISAKGDFHSFGRFVSSIATLPRIVSVESFTVKTDPPVEGDTSNSGYPSVSYVIKASTYRYLDITTESRPSVTGSEPQAPVDQGATQ